MLPPSVMVLFDTKGFKLSKVTCGKETKLLCSFRNLDQLKFCLCNCADYLLHQNCTLCKHQAWWKFLLTISCITIAHCVNIEHRGSLLFLHHNCTLCKHQAWWKFAVAFFCIRIAHCVNIEHRGIFVMDIFCVPPSWSSLSPTTARVGVPPSSDHLIHLS